MSWLWPCPTRDLRQKNSDATERRYSVTCFLCVNIYGRTLTCPDDRPQIHGQQPTAVSFAASFGHVVIQPAARDDSYGNDTAELGIAIEAVVGAAQLATAPEATAPEMTFQEDRDRCYEIIAARYRKPGEDLSSTERKLRPTHKRWTAFCEQEGIEPDQKPRFLDPFLKHDMAKMRKFVTYLDGQNLSIGQMEDGILFIQHHLKHDCNVHDQPTIKGAVRADAVINSIINQSRQSKATRIVDKGTDIQAKLDVRISDKQMDGLVEECFAPLDPAVSQMHELSRLQTASGIRHTQTTGQRGQGL